MEMDVFEVADEVYCKSKTSLKEIYEDPDVGETLLVLKTITVVAGLVEVYQISGRSKKHTVIYVGRKLFLEYYPDKIELYDSNVESIINVVIDFAKAHKLFKCCLFRKKKDIIF